MRKTVFEEILPVTACMALSMILSVKHLFLVSGLILILCGMILFIIEVKESGKLLSPAALFSLSFLSCVGVSCLKLSELQKMWECKTWLSFYLIFVSFMLSYHFFSEKQLIKRTRRTDSPGERGIARVILGLTLVSWLCFAFEAWKLGYIPLFTVDTPHAYSYFHISGVHYFTVLCSLVPPSGILYFHEVKGQAVTRRNVSVLICVTASLFLPVLLVSRYQLVFSCILSAVTFIILEEGNLRKYLKMKYVLAAILSVLCLIVLYILITVERAHSVEYLNGIFEMKNPKTLIWFTQPYIYIANNFDNFNCLVADLKEHTLGLRMLFPFFALTGLKFRFPELVSFPLYVTKEELTTVTMFYDAYYDFGIAGVIVFSMLLGLLLAFTEKLSASRKHSFSVVICAQIYAYLILAFFTTWFSNPTTWFYLIISIAIEAVLCYSENLSARKERLETK